MSLRLATMTIALSVVCALSLCAIAPLHFAIPGAIVVVVAGAYFLQRHGAQKYMHLVSRLEAIKGVRASSTRLGVWSDPGRRFEELSSTLVRDLEDSYFRLIRTNIQLLSLKEVGRSIIASLDRDRTVQSVLEYLQRGVGFQEFGLFTWLPEEGVFAGTVRHRQGDGFDWQPSRFALPEVDGVLSRALGKQRSYLIKDAALHPLGTLQQEPLFPQAAFQSYVVVPMVQNQSPGNEWERLGCAALACPAAPGGEVESWSEKFTDEPDPAYWDGGRFRCWDCSAFPSLGFLVVTDTGRDVPLSKIDLIMLETLAQNLSTVLENARLYEDLKREERFREHVFQSMSNGLLTVDLQGNVLLFNQAAERLSGFREVEVRGCPSGDLVTHARSGRDPLREALETGRMHRGLEASLVTSNGKGLPIRLAISLLRDENAKVYGAIGEFADQSAIKALEAQIRHLDKLAALGRFTSSIAHEIRNPLAGLTAGIQYLRKRMEPESQEHVDFILAEVDRMNRIIEDLFRVGRPLDLMLQEADVEDLVERSLRMLAPRFEERGIRTRRLYAQDLPPVAVDADRIEQVLINLIQNAVEASPTGGEVGIEMRLGSSQEPLHSNAAADSLVVVIRDEGEGIAEENRDKIFEPFFTTKAQGTGLGLYVCHHIIEGHGGSIVVESAPGQGTRFVLCLPLGRILMGGHSETADLAGR